MGASRENMNIFYDIKRKNWNELSKKVKILLSIGQYSGNQWNRKYIIKDSFQTPFNKLIGCKLFKHKWSTEKEILDYDLDDYVCWKCNKRESFSTRKSNKRDEIINKIIK